MTKTVGFIGKQYELPDDLETYIELSAFIDDLRDGLILDIMLTAQKDENSIITNDDALPLIKVRVGKVIQKLTANEIYHRTIEDYLYNDGYEAFTDVNLEAQKQAYQRLIDAAEELKYGYDYAQQRAADSITGTGYSVYSGSILTSLAVSAYESSVMEKQSRNAQWRYRQEIDELNYSIGAKREMEAADYLHNVFLPNVVGSMMLFASNILDQYISDLVDENKFSKETLKYTDSNRSASLLENLALAQNKPAVLETAFLACPFNETVYEKVAELGLCDVETLKTAVHYCPDNNVIKGIVDGCHVKPEHENYADEYERIVSLMPVLTDYLKASEREVADMMFKRPIEYYTKKLSVYEKLSALTDLAFVKKFVKSNIDDNDHSSFYLKKPEEIHCIVKTCIEKDVNQANFIFLKTQGFLSDKEADISYWVKVISGAIVRYQDMCRTEREKLETAKMEHERAIKERDDSISRLESDLYELGIFAFSKKKQLRSRIESAKKERMDYRYSDQGKRYSRLSDSFLINYI